MSQPATDVSGVRVFEAKKPVGLQAAMFIAGGVFFLLVLIAQFLIQLGRKSSTGNDMMPGIIGGLSVVGIGLIGRGIFLLRGVTRVTLDDAGVHLDGFIARRFVAYHEIDRIERDKKNAAMGGITAKALVLRSTTQSKPLAVITETIDRFEELATELAARTQQAQGGRVTYDPAADQQNLQAREARKMKWLSVAMTVFAILFLAMFAYGLNEELHDRRLHSRGVETSARIDKHFMRSVTPYIAYSFDDQSGKPHEREVMVTPELYAATEGEAGVPVVYLTDEPDWNRPVTGDASTQMGGKSLFLFGGVALMFSALAVLMMLGIDIKSDNGYTTIVRRGKVIREWGKKPAPPAAPPPYAPPVPLPRAEQPPMNVAVPILIPPAPSKPRGLLVLGVLCIVFGLLGAGLGLIRWAASVWVPSRTIKLGEQAIEASQPAWALPWTFADLALAVALMLVGVGLILRKRWSRTIGIPVALLQIASNVASAVVVAVTMAQAPSDPAPEAMTLVALNIASIIVKLIGAVFPGVLLFILAKRSTSAALLSPVE